MALAPGTRLGPYEITAQIGAGGMGEVYRATDTNLGREVAIKVVPEVFARDAEHLARFQREAKTLALLNHPHIAIIHGFEQTSGIKALVMELVTGPTLAERIAQGPLPLEEALPIARQIIAALEAAHDHGIVHRDLKPANIKLTAEGSVKILDFGLAKATTEDRSIAQSNSPTLTVAATREGIILGTAAYMSPEQARAKAVDKRTDVWAFGCVLYEMLTGRRAFEGESATEVLARIIEREPDFGKLPPTTPTAIRRLLRRSLTKDRSRRLADIADARIEIDEALSPLPGEDLTGGFATRRSLGERALVLLVLGVVAVVLVATYAVWNRSPQSPPRQVRFFVTLPAAAAPYWESIGPAVAVSPDGRYIIFPALRGGTLQLYARRSDQVEARPIPGTEGGRQPFLSPDGQSVGFWAPASGELKRVPIGGGLAVTICKAPSGSLYGATWLDDGTIIFASGSLFRVSDGGGSPQRLTTPAIDGGEVEHRWPEVLPGARAVVFGIWSGSGSDQARVVVRSLETGEQKVLLEGTNSARYAESGHLIYVQNAMLTAAPFDATRLEITGARTPVQEIVRTNATYAAEFALARDGTLAFVPGTAKPERKLVWVDRAGRASPLIDVADDYWFPRLSPDGTRLAVGVGNDIWVIDLKRLSRTRVTFDVTTSLFPFAWSNDGERITFSKVEKKVGLDLHTASAEGSGQSERFAAGEHRQWATSWSPDGQRLALYEQHPTTLRDIWMLDRGGQRTAFQVTQYQERSATFSPDGRWVAYVSNESGRDEVYVQPFAGKGRKETVSTEGGTEPVWSANGREIFYRTGDRVMVASVESKSGLAIGEPRVLFVSSNERDRGSGASNPNYAVTPDGQRFIMIQAPSTSSSIVVVLNWFEELKRLVPAR